MILASYEKQPSEVKDYDIDYTEWLTPAQDTIDDITAVVTSDTEATPTLIVDSIQNTLLVGKVWLSGGTANTKYKLTVQMTTVGGRVDESELIFSVKDR